MKRKMRVVLLPLLSLLMACGLDGQPSGPAEECRLAGGTPLYRKARVPNGNPMTGGTHTRLVFVECQDGGQ